MGLLSPVRMVLLPLLLMFLLNQSQSQALAKPGQGRPTDIQVILETDQGLKIITQLSDPGGPS